MKYAVRHLLAGFLFSFLIYASIKIGKPFLTIYFSIIALMYVIGEEEMNIFELYDTIRWVVWMYVFWSMFRRKKLIYKVTGMFMEKVGDILDFFYYRLKFWRWLK